MAGAALRETVRLRLVRADDVPPDHDLVEPYEFGLQDIKQALTAPVRRSDGMLAFDFALEARSSPGAERPQFYGPFASGPPDDRFVYLSWRSIPRGVWINRVKARLGGIDWKLVRAAVAAKRPLEADMSGWRPHDNRRQVSWRLAQD